MKQSWLNMILRLTAKIYKTKQRLLTASSSKGAVLAVTVILLEIVLFVISIPFYFIVGEKFAIGKSGGKDVISYRLRRKFIVSLFFFILMVALAVFALKGIINVFFTPDIAKSTI